MILNNRVIFGDNAVLKDISLNMNDFKSGIEVLPLVAADDYIYLGSQLPFNHRWFEVDVVNSLSSVISVDLWDGNAWEGAVDVIDQTSINGVPFAQSGYISWVLDKNESWAQEDTVDANEEENVTGLGDKKIFDMYWARMKVSINLTVATALKFIGNKFSNESDLGILYADLITSDAKTQFQSGKTDWKDQEFKAAEEIIRNLKSSGVILNSNQILNWEQFTDASVHKIAEIIFRSYGDDFNDNRRTARGDFKEAMRQEIFQIDRNRNARLDDNERFSSAGRLHR